MNWNSPRYFILCDDHELGEIGLCLFECVANGCKYVCTLVHVWRRYAVVAAHRYVFPQLEYVLVCSKCVGSTLITHLMQQHRKRRSRCAEIYHVARSQNVDIASLSTMHCGGRSTGRESFRPEGYRVIVEYIV